VNGCVLLTLWMASILLAIGDVLFHFFWPYLLPQTYWTASECKFSKQWYPVHRIPHYVCIFLTEKIWNRKVMWLWLLQASVRLMPSTMLYSGRSADEIHLIVSIKKLIVCCCVLHDHCLLLLLLLLLLMLLLHYYCLFLLVLLLLLFVLQCLDAVG